MSFELFNAMRGSVLNIHSTLVHSCGGGDKDDVTSRGTESTEKDARRNKLLNVHRNT